MRTVRNSIIAFMAMGAVAVAGGNEVPVEAVVVDVPTEVVASPVDVSGFYLKPMYSFMRGDDKRHSAFDGHVLQTAVGYNFNAYIGIEGRAGATLSDESIKINGSSTATTDFKMGTINIFVKPQYPVTEDFSVYALVGYGQVTLEDEKESGFQWGAGVEYMMNEKYGVFVDYTRLFDGDDFANYKTNEAVESFNVGITFKF